MSGQKEEFIERLGIELCHDESGAWFWRDGHCTTQLFSSRVEAEEAMTREVQEMERLGLNIDSTASAGILEWD